MSDAPATLWRCPVCPVILVGPQIANTETHLNEHERNN